MGQRANLILVEGREYQLFYSHWCANTLPRDLFWGPEHAVAFIRIQRAVDDSGWLDEVWAEGGAVVDLDRKHFLLYGGWSSGWPAMHPISATALQELGQDGRPSGIAIVTRCNSTGLKGLLRFPFPDRQTLLDSWRKTLLREAGTSPVATVQMLAEHDREQGKDVQVNPWALRDDRLQLSKEERTAILDTAMSHL